MQPSPDSQDLILQGFASLIQLWACICLLFFYEAILTKSPLHDFSKQVESLYNDFINRYNGFVHDYAKSSEDYVKDNWTSNYLPTIKSIASISFFYSAFVLAFIGIENNKNLGGVFYCALPVMDTIVVIYIVLAIIFYKCKIFHGLKSSIALFVILLVYFPLHFKINDACLRMFCIGEVLSKSAITIYTILTCLGGLLIISFRLFLSWCVLGAKSAQ